MVNPTFDVIIPTWNGKELLKKNIPAVLKALEKIPTAQKKLMVVEDGSRDGSAEFLTNHFPEVELFVNEKNLGFHRSINRGASHSKAAIVLLLNSDMEPKPESFLRLYEAFQGNPDLFAVSGAIYSEDKKTFLYGNRGGSFRLGHFHLAEKPEEDASQTLFACGGAGAFHRERFLELGGFDSVFSPFYYEEQDISYRALKRGWKIAYQPKSVMYHAVGVTIQKKVVEQKRRRISARNNYLFVLKNITDLKMTVAAVFFTPLFVLTSLLKGNPRFLFAFLGAIPRLPEVLLKRFKEQKYYIRTDKEIFRAIQINSHRSTETPLPSLEDQNEIAHA